MNISNHKRTLLQFIEEDREELIQFLSNFIKAKSPNPPGDTSEPTALISKLLSAKKLPFRVISPNPKLPNIVGSLECGMPGRHLVLNGHMDVFPVAAEKWTYEPWSGAVANGRIYGRGACDMKCGTTASIFTFVYLYRIRDQLKGRLTLTAVSDEETFGPWGARYLLENHPEVRGDCLLNGEPGSPYTIRFGEKGLLWLTFNVNTQGHHAAYTHISEGAIKIASRLITELDKTLDLIQGAMPDNVVRTFVEGKEVMEKVLGKGASKITQKISLNVGTLHGGVKINMIPSQCSMEVDIRLPLGMKKDYVMKEIEGVVARFPEVTVQEINFSPPSWSDPQGEMAEILRANVRDLKGFDPLPISSLGGSDTRLWRYKGVPAYIYGPSPTGLGGRDECVEIEEFLHIVKTHVLSAYDYLSRGQGT